MGDRKVVHEMGEWHASCVDCGWESFILPGDGGVLSATALASERARHHTRVNPTHTVMIVDPAGTVRGASVSASEAVDK